MNDEFEEALSKVLGDIAAHRIVGGLKAADAWRRDSAERLFENLAEYLVEEQGLLVPRRELLDLRAGTDALRADLDRLERRTQQLETP